MSSASPIPTERHIQMANRLNEHITYLETNKGRFGTDIVTYNEIIAAHFTTIQKINDILMTREIGSRAVDGVPKHTVRYDKSGAPIIHDIEEIRREPWEDQLEAGKLNPPSYMQPPIGKF